MAAQIIIEPTTAQAYSTSFVLTMDSTSATITCFGLQDTETAQLEIYDNISGNWFPVLTDDFFRLFSVTNNIINIFNIFGALLRVNKGVTINPVGVTLLIAQ